MINLAEQRFTVIGANTMLELVASMNKNAHPLARVIYFGLNYGDYSDVNKYPDNTREAVFIAVFDYSPAMVYPVDEFSIEPHLDDNEGLDDVANKNDIVMSA